jgi:phytoene dehydrogenase-like protein
VVGLRPRRKDGKLDWESFTEPCPKCHADMEVAPMPPTAIYVCSGGHRHGTAVCKCRRVHEADLVHIASRLIEEEVLAGDRAEWRRRVEERLREVTKSDPGELKTLRKKLADLTKKIDQGAERFLTAPAALTATLAEKLTAWRTEHEALAERAATLAGAADQARNVPAVADAVVEAFGKLQIALLGADPAARAAVLRRVIERVTVVWEGTTSEVRSVRVKLRPDAFVVRNLVAELTTLVWRLRPFRLH